jgi:hypothetical protein
MKLTNADAFPNSTSIPQPLVTPDLDPETQTADHRQGGGGARRNHELGPNPFVLKILTSKPLGLKILQTIFANPAPVAAFREGDGGGYPLNLAISQNGLAEKALVKAPRRKFFLGVSLQ